MSLVWRRYAIADRGGPRAFERLGSQSRPIPAVEQSPSEGEDGAAVLAFVIALPGIDKLQGRLAAQQYVRSAGSCCGDIDLSPRE